MLQDITFSRLHLSAIATPTAVPFDHVGMYGSLGLNHDVSSHAPHRGPGFYSSSLHLTDIMPGRNRCGKIVYVFT